MCISSSTKKVDKLIKVWVNNKKLWGSWVKKRRFFDDFLTNYSNHASSYIHKILGFEEMANKKNQSDS